MPTATTELLASADAHRIAVLRLDDGKANAFNPAGMAAITAELDAIDASDARALVLTGRPGFFSGGLDLKALPRLSTADKRATLLQFGELLLRVFTCRMPTVAAVSGHAIAGGALLALACDTRFGVEGPARFGITEVAIGLPVPTFGLVLARAALTTPALTELAVHATVLDHASAVSRGVFTSVHAPDTLVGVAVAHAGTLEARRRRIRGDEAAPPRRRDRDGAGDPAR
jgi:enoyl-CoA hydratase